MSPEYDTFAQLEEMIDSQMKGNWEWVRSHQDDSTNPIAILNNDADKLAKEGWESTLHTPKVK